jgi:hypothetical protein
MKALEPCWLLAKSPHINAASPLTKGSFTVAGQLELFAAASHAPEGLRYQEEFIAAEDEAELIRRIGGLPLQPFQFGAFEGKRRVALLRLPIRLHGTAVAGSRARSTMACEYRRTRRGIRRRWDPDCPDTLYRICNGRRHWLAQGQAAFWNRVRALARLFLRLPFSTGCRRKMATLHARRRAAVSLRHDWRLAPSLGAQHPAGRGAPLFHHFSDHGLRPHLLNWRRLIFS